MATYQVKQSSTAYPLVFLMVQSSDHITGLTGASPTVTISKSGGTFSSPSGAVTEIANGWYKVAGNATDSATLGPLALHATAASGDPCDELYEVVAIDPQSTAFGLSLAKTTNLTGLNDIAATAIVTSGAITTSGGKVSGVILADTVTNYTGNTPQTGDNYPRLGAPAGASISADIAAVKSETDTILTDVNTGAGAIYTRLGAPAGASMSADIAAVKTSVGIPAQAATALSNVQWTNGRAANLDNLDAAVSSRLATSGYTTPPTAAAIATAILTDTTAGDFAVTGSPGHILVTQLGGAFTTTSSSIFSTASLANAPTGGGGGLTLATTLNAARALDSIADTSLTINDALQCAVAAITAQVDASSGSTVTFKTASTATLLRTKSLTLIAPPSQVPDKAI